MQNSSASDLLSVELSFQTACEEIDGEDKELDSTGRQQQQLNGERSRMNSKLSERLRGESDGGLDERQADETRRISLTGAERANRWRLDGTLRRDRARLQTRVSDLVASISRSTGDIEVGANNAQRVRLETFTANADANGCCQQQAPSSDLTQADDGSALQPAVQIHVDSCGEVFTSKPPPVDNTNLRLLTKQLVALHFDQPPSRSSSSIDLRAYGSGGSALTRTWNDKLTELRSGNQMEKGSEQDLLLLSVRPQDTTGGSLSDGAYKLTKYPAGSSKLYKPFSKRRFENWKRANRIITNICENPLGMHLDCLDQFETFQECNPPNNDKQAGTETHQAGVKSVREQTTQTIDDKQQPRDLTNYANNLSHLYRKNRESMDSSQDFRGLLYNIICCLLVQDEQVLATVSVGKMLDVIRTHLESASRIYANTSGELLRNLSLQFVASQQEAERCPSPEEDQVVTSGGEESTMLVMANQLKQPAEPANSTTTTTHRNDQLNTYRRQSKRQKPADFRRISSVSFNDEQLIKDLRGEQQDCDHFVVVRRSGSLSAESSGKHQHEPSPWAYRELSDRREGGPSHRLDSAGSSNHTTTNSTATTTTTTTTAAAHYTSQSSLEQTMNNSDGPQMDLMNDSGNGTMCDSQVVSDLAGYSNLAERRRGRASFQSGAERRAISLCSESFGMMVGGGGAETGPIESLAGECNHRASSKRRLSEFKPMQQPSYMSTDDYLSTTNNFNWCAQNHQRTSLYEDENSSAQLQKCDFNSNSQQQQCFAQYDDQKCPSDAPARRAELEWTLNKLINIELKLTWLTSRDTLRRAIRKIGVPNEIRGKVWLILIDQMIGSKYNAANLIELARETVEQMDEKLIKFDDETRSILKQIELDVNRTMPGHRLFDDGAEGGVKLRRILVAYSIHVNRAIAYCQGFNFIVALLLSVFEGNEVDALRGFICIVDHIFPSKYYFDHYLTGARADQFLLADFICDQLIKSPTMAERKMVEGVTSSITLNWFISLFHGAVPTLTRLTILDHFMLEGVKALFRFTMAILYLAFQVTPPSSCEIFTTIRNTARDMYDIKLLLSIVEQIKLPKDSYFAIRRSFYMVQSSFNSDQFYMQTFSNEASRILVANKPLNCQQQLSCPTKPPSLSLISSASNICQMNSATDEQANRKAAFSYQQFTIKNSVYQDLMQRPRSRTSSDRSKICVQSIGKLGRSHLRIIDANARSNERSLMSPLRNCTLIGISNCGKNLVIARQSSKRNFRSFKEQDLTFEIHEITNEIFDGFYLEETQQVLIITHHGEIFKIDHGKCLEDNKLAKPNYLDICTETLLLRDSIGGGTGSMAPDRQQEKMKLRLSTLDSLTNLLWIYVECESSNGNSASRSAKQLDQLICRSPETIERSTKEILPRTTARFKHNNPFLDGESDGSNSTSANDNNNSRQKSCPESKSLRRDLRSFCDSQRRASQANKSSFSRKIIIVDLITFDLFSAFTVHPNFGEITNLRASLVAFCQLSNPMSNQFSTRIVQIGPTGRYEQLLSFSDVADYMVNVPESFKKRYHKQSNMDDSDKDRASKLQQQQQQQQRYSSLRRFLTSSISFSVSSNQSNSLEPQSRQNDARGQQPACDTNASGSSNTLTKYYRSLMRSSSSSCAGQPVPRVQTPAIEVRNDSNKFQSQAGDWSSSSSSTFSCDTKPAHSKKQVPKLIQDGALRSIISSSFGDFSELSETNYIPVNMAFIFRNGKIALFEFTESYAIHTREAQLDRYDYSRVIDVTKNGEDFIVTILTVCDKLIKIII